MTVNPHTYSAQSGSTSNKDTSARSGPTQMDEVEGQRLKLFTEDSLAASGAEPINLEDTYYALLQRELEADAQNLESESWSLAVDQDYLNTLSKEAVKVQDVIYELIQTEMHQVRTLKILKHVYLHELRQSLLMEEAKLDDLFAGVDALLTLHQFFLKNLKMRQCQSYEEGSSKNYQISQLGDLLISQFSGILGERMKEYYGFFCGHQTEAISLYKEQMQTNKKLNSLIKKIGQLPLVRRLGIPECFLLVTQRITKYPVLVERIIKSTTVDSDEYESLVQGLTLIKDNISQVNSQVSEYEKVARLKGICLRLEPKSQGYLKDGRLFRREDMMQDNRKLLYEGPATWKSSSRQKDIHAVLLSDRLLLLQEKDQKFVFAALDNKPPVISLQNLIVREVAHEHKAMYLISACTSTMSEMYEIHTSSREECRTWISLIREAVNCFSELYEEDSELTATLQNYQDQLKDKDLQIRECLAEKQQLLSNLFKDLTGHESPSSGLLLPRDPTDLLQGETLLQGAINEVEILQSLVLPSLRDPNLLDGNKRFRRIEAYRAADDGVGAEDPHGSEETPIDPQPKELYHNEGQEQSADGHTEIQNSSSISTDLPEVCDHLILLGQRLYSLQAIIAQQDSRIELQQVLQSKSKPPRFYSSILLEQEKQRNLEKQKEELANLHKLKAQHRQVEQQWEKEKEQQSIKIKAHEAELKQREEKCRRWEENLSEEKSELKRQKQNYQQDLERLRESTKSVEKEEERLNQEKERLEQLQEKFKKHMSLVNSGYHDDPTCSLTPSNYQSFRGSLVNGVGNLFPQPQIFPKEIPPKVPPRRESIIYQPGKSEMPIHLVNTTKQVFKPATLQQQIPTKLANVSKEKDKGFRKKGSHQRTHSAASIDVSQVVPIRVTGKEGGSLRAIRNVSPHSIQQSDTFKPPGSVHSVKMSQSFSTPVRSSGDDPPPVPPPFPKEVLEMSKEKVIFL